MYKDFKNMISRAVEKKTKNHFAKWHKTSHCAYTNTQEYAQIAFRK